MTKLSGVFAALDFSETIALSQHKILACLDRQICIQKQEFQSLNLDGQGLSWLSSYLFLELSIRHVSTDGFAGTGSPARQFLGPHIPEQSVRHYYFDGGGLLAWVLENRSATLSLLNKVCNSIQYKKSRKMKAESPQKR